VNNFDLAFPGGLDQRRIIDMTDKLKEGNWVEIKAEIVSILNENIFKIKLIGGVPTQFWWVGKEVISNGRIIDRPIAVGDKVKWAGRGNFVVIGIDGNRAWIKGENNHYESVYFNGLERIP